MTYPLATPDRPMAPCCSSLTRIFHPSAGLLRYSHTDGDPSHHPSFPRRRESIPSSVIPAKAGIHNSRARGNSSSHYPNSSFPRSRVGMQTCPFSGNHPKAAQRFPRRSMGTGKPRWRSARSGVAGRHVVECLLLCYPCMGSGADTLCRILPETPGQFQRKPITVMMKTHPVCLFDAQTSCRIMTSCHGDSQ